MHMCVFCGSMTGTSKKYAAEAKKLGKLLGKRKHTLVYGGGNIGLMGKLAKAVQENQGKTIGVLPKVFENDRCSEDELVMVETFERRKAVMESKSDAFIVLAGGIGTIDEATDVLVSKQHKFHNKPLVFINTNGFFDNFLAHLDKILFFEFATAESKNLWFVAKDSEEALRYVEAFQNPKISKKS